MESTRIGFEDVDGSNPPQSCNKSYDWGASLSGEFLQEIALHAGVQSWGALRCVCQNWRRGISQAVRTVRLTVPDRSTAPAVQPPAEQLAGDAPRPARRGAAAGRPPGRGAAAANHQQQQAPPLSQRQPVPAAAAFTSALHPDPHAQGQGQGRQPSHSPNLQQQQQQQQQPRQNDGEQRQQQQPKATAGRGFAASSGRPPPQLSLLHPPDAPAATAAIHSQRHQPDNAAVLVSLAPTATAVAAAPACPEAAGAAGAAITAAGGGSDVSFGRIAAVVRRPPVFEPHHDLEPLNCVFNLHRQSTVAAVAAAAAAATAAAAAARTQGEASDSQAAGVASSVGSSSIVVWSFLEAADKLAAAFPLYDNLSLNFAEPLPLAACGGGGGGGGGGSEVGSGRWLQLEMSSALQKLLSERLVSLTLSGHTPYPLFMAPPPLPLLTPAAAPPPASSPRAAVVAGAQPAGGAAAAAAHHLQEPPRQHHRLQRSSKRSSVAIVAGGAAAAAAAAAAAPVAAAAADATAAKAVASVQGGEVSGAAGGAAEGLTAGGVGFRAACRTGCGGSEGTLGASEMWEGAGKVPPPLATLLPPPLPQGGRPNHQDHHILRANGGQPQLSGGCHMGTVGAYVTAGDALSPWRSRHVAAAGSGGILTVADVVKALEEEATEDDPMGLRRPTWAQVGMDPGSSGERGAASGAAGGGAASRRRRRVSPAADAPPSMTAPPSVPYTFRADKSLTPPSDRTEGPPAQRQCCEGGAAATKAEARRDVPLTSDSTGAPADALAPGSAPPALPQPELKSPAATTANGYRGSSGSAPSHGSLGPRRYAGSGNGAQLEADGSGAAGNDAGRERCGSGVPNTPGPAEGGYCALFEGRNSGGSGADVGGNGGGSGDPMDLGDAGDGAALAVLMEANGSGRSPGSGDDIDVCVDGGGGGGFGGCGGSGGLARSEYGMDPMDASGDVQAALGFRCVGVPSHRCQPLGSAVAVTTDAMILEEDSLDAGGSGGATLYGGGGSSDGNGSGRRCPAPDAAAAAAAATAATAAAAAATAAAGARTTAGSDSNPSHGLGLSLMSPANNGVMAHAASARGADGPPGGEPTPVRHLAEPATAQAAAATGGDNGSGGGVVTVSAARQGAQLAGVEAAAAAIHLNNARASPAVVVTPAAATAPAAAARAAATAAGAPAAAPPPVALLPLGGSHRLATVCAVAAPPALGGGGGGGGGRAVPLLSRLSQLVSLTLVADVRFPSPQQLEAITSLRALQRLDLRGAKFMQVDGDVSPLGRQAWLHLGNDHVAVVARCTSLTSLSLNHLHPVGGPQLVALTALSRLTHLALMDALSGNAVHGCHIKALASGLSNLRSLEIGRVTCPPLHLPPQQQPQQPPASAAGAGAAPPPPGALSPGPGPPATPPSWQPWGPVLCLFQRLTTLHLQVACSFETELLSGVAALPLLVSFSMELLDVPPPQLAAMLEVLAAGPAGSAGGGADSGSPPKAALLPPSHRHSRRAAAAAAAVAAAKAAGGGGGGLSRVLRGLTLTACMLYDEHLELMGRLRQLRCIRLDQVDIRTRDPDGWTALSGARSLESFSFRVWNNPVLSASNLCVLTNDCLAMMAANWPKLQQLNYCGKVALTEKAEEHVALMTRITSLDISGTDGTLLRVWRSTATGQLLRSVTLPYNATAKVSSRNGYVTYSDSDDSAKSEGSEASVNWMGDMGYVTSEYDAD